LLKFLGYLLYLILQVKAVDVFNAYQKGDVTAGEIIDKGIDALAQYFGTAMAALPAVPYVEVFGTISEKQSWYVERAVEKLKGTHSYQANRDPNSPTATQFLVTQTERLGLKGAVELAYHEGLKKA